MHLLLYYGLAKQGSHVMQLEKYQEQAQLLDPHLEAMITPLAGLLMHAALMPSSINIQVVQHVSKMLWSIASARCLFYIYHFDHACCQVQFVLPKS